MFPVSKRRSQAGTRLVLGLAIFALAACGAEVGDDGAGSTSTTTSAATTSTDAEPNTTTTAAPATTTPTAPPDDLLVVGDWGSGTMPQGAVAGAMQRYAEMTDITAILTTGDNFYSDDFEFLTQPFSWATDSGIPFWITWGNHDVESATRIAGIDATFDSPPRWTVHEWGDVDIVILDSTQVTSPEQAVFFIDAMAASTRPTIVVLHHPPFSCSHTEEGTEFVEEWIGLLDGEVALVLSGHDHSYQRFEQEGTVYVVTGGGGSPLYELEQCPANHPELVEGASVHHFLALTRTAGEIGLTAIDVNGAVIDQTSIPTS